MEEMFSVIFGFLKPLVKAPPVNWVALVVVIYILVSVSSIEKDIKGIKENFDNHITETDERLEKLDDDIKQNFRIQNERFDRLYEILLKKEIEKK